MKKGFSVFQYSLTRKDGSGSGFGSWKTVPAVPVPRSVPGKTVPTVPVSGSGSWATLFLCLTVVCLCSVLLPVFLSS